MSGDEFVVLFEANPDEPIEAQADRLNRVLREPVLLTPGRAPAQVTASIGIAYGRYATPDRGRVASARDPDARRHLHRRRSRGHEDRLAQDLVEPFRQRLDRLIGVGLEQDHELVAAHPADRVLLLGPSPAGVRRPSSAARRRPRVPSCR